MNSWKMVEFAFGPENANHTETFDFIKSLSMFGIHNFISSPSHNLLFIFGGFRLNHQLKRKQLIYRGYLCEWFQRTAKEAPAFQKS